MSHKPAPETIAQQHMESFFREGRHKDLLRIAGNGNIGLFESLSNKYASKHISHLHGRAWELAYSGIMSELRKKAGLSS